MIEQMADEMKIEWLRIEKRRGEEISAEKSILLFTP